LVCLKADNLDGVTSQGELSASSPFGTAQYPTELIIVGAAAGIGRWLGEHVLRDGPSAGAAWERVTLLDTAEIGTALGTYSAPVVAAQILQSGAAVSLKVAGAPGEVATSRVDLGRPNTCVLLAVPMATLGSVAAWLLPLLHPSAIVVDTSMDRATAARTLESARPGLINVGLHALFGIMANSPEGQIFAVCPSAVDPDAHRWLVSAIEAAGGTVNELASQRHDEIMRYVQAASHQALLTFADVIGSSGLDLEKDLWANRTPVFELLMSLASRVLTPGQESTIASIQLADTNQTVSTQMTEAQSRLHTAVEDSVSQPNNAAVSLASLNGRDRAPRANSAEPAPSPEPTMLPTDRRAESGTPAEGDEPNSAASTAVGTSNGIETASADRALTEYLSDLRAPFSSGLFTKMQQAATLATGAVQSTRARVAEQRRAAELIAVRTLGQAGQGERLHVGRVRKVTATSFVLDDLLVGTQGKAALLIDDAAVQNARKLGIGGKAKTVEFSLGRVQVLSARETEDELDAWLASVQRGVKVLIPESIAGASAARVVAGVPFVRKAELISEEVRIGERECVVRVWARMDRNMNALERDIQNRVDDVFLWPDGVVLPLANGGATKVGFLGPAGTFSDIAARRAGSLLRTVETRGVASEDVVITRHEYPDFDAIVGAVVGGDVDVAVVPITNSSSGLVDLAANVLSSPNAHVVAGGVVDVPVRFDAYMAPGSELVSGSDVYSHPQGFRQCSAFIAAHNLREIPCTSTAEACRLVQSTGAGIALAAAGLGDEFALDLARANVGNLAGALTRFLVVGRADTFGPPVRVDATFRSVWIVGPPIASSGSAGAGVGLSRLGEGSADGARYDEVLRGPSGALLVISTRADRLDGVTDARFLGTIPWSPRTPLVVV
jgi:prephenate dehydratase/prephenate dehydrogenase